MLRGTVRHAIPFLILFASFFVSLNAPASYSKFAPGNLVSKSGSLADANLIRFSGKEHHTPSGLYYNGYRYYAPNLQRWMNEDPIGIAGGLNLHGFVGNDPIDLVDADGRLYGEVAAELAGLLGGLADNTSSPGVGYVASLAEDLANAIAGTDLNYAVGQDLQSLAQNGVGGYAEQKYGQLEEAVGTADLVRMVDSGHEYSDLERAIYGASGIAKTALCIAGGRGLVGKGAAAETAASEVGSGTSTAPAGKAVAPAKPECSVKGSIPKPPKGKGSVPPSERDPKRVFPKTEKADTLAKRGGTCDQCNKQLPIDEAKGHHIDRHADGGRTTKDNLAVVCEDCHKELHE